MQDELINAFTYLSNISTSTLQTFDNRNFIVQHLNNTFEISSYDLKCLLYTQHEYDDLMNLLQSCTKNEYVIVAYFDGKAIGAKRIV